MRFWLVITVRLLIPAPGWAAEDRSQVLLVGTSGDYGPFSLGGEGFDIEVARRLAADLGLRLEWVRFRWPELQADAGADAFDVAMSGVTWRPERAVSGWTTRAAELGPRIDAWIAENEAELRALSTALLAVRRALDAGFPAGPLEPSAERAMVRAE